MTIFTSEPCIQVYTGNFQEGLPHYGDGVAHKHNGICLETQHSPNAINLPDLAEGVISDLVNTIIIKQFMSLRRIKECYAFFGFF